jgi:hypothetical protein
VHIKNIVWTLAKAEMKIQIKIVIPVLFFGYIAKLQSTALDYLRYKVNIAHLASSSVFNFPYPSFFYL